MKSAVSPDGFIYPIQGKITSTFGTRVLLGKQETHSGLDFAGRLLVTPVFAAKGGTVTVAGKSRTLGLWVEIAHAKGWVTRYGHLSWQHVRRGKRVLRGDLIGRIGNSGRSTGSHLHFEVRQNGVCVDPLTVLPPGGPQAPAKGVPQVRYFPDERRIVVSYLENPGCCAGLP